MAITKVTTGGITDATITNADIANSTITAAKLASGVQTDISGNANNRIITGSGSANTLNGESTFTYDGSGNLGVANSSGSVAVTVTTANNTDGGIYFTDGSDGNKGAISYLHTDDSMKLRANGQTRMTIDSSGRLLLGTTTEGNANGDEVTIAKDSGNMGITLRSGDSSNSHIYFSDATSGAGEYAGYVAYQHSDDSLHIGTNSAERVRIKSDGKVGIGKTPSSTLDVETASNANGFNINCVGSAPNYLMNVRDDNVSKFYISSGGKILLNKDSTSQTHTLQVQADSNANAVAIYGRSSDDIGELGFYENDGSTRLGELQYRQDHLNFRHRVGYMKFATTDSGTLREVASIGSKGHFAIKGNAGSFVSGSSVPTDVTYHQFANTGNGQWCMQLKQEHHNGMNTQLLVNSVTNIEAFQIYSLSNNSTRFRVLNNGNCANANNSFGSLSDVKLKENIVDAKSQWNDVKAVKVRNFNFKNDKDSKLLGVVAQEVESVSSGLVFDTIDRDPNDSTKEIGTTKNVKYSILYMKAFKALQEAMARIEVLEAKVA